MCAIFFWSLILKDFIQVKKIKGEFVVVCSRPPRALTWDKVPQGAGGGGGRPPPNADVFPVVASLQSEAGGD